MKKKNIIAYLDVKQVINRRILYLNENKLEYL